MRSPTCSARPGCRAEHTNCVDPDRPRAENHEHVLRAYGSDDAPPFGGVARSEGPRTAGAVSFDRPRCTTPTNGGRHDRPVHHHVDSVRQRGPAPGARVGVRRRGHARPTSPPHGAATSVSSGTDDHAIKNVAAAEAAGVPVADLVATNGDRFADLTAALAVGTDGFLRTSSDPRHAPACGRPLAGLPVRRGPLHQGLHRVVLHRLRTVLRPRRARRAACASSTGRRPPRSPRRTGSSGCPGYREQITALITSGRLRHHARRAPQRGPRLLGRRRAGPVGVASGRPHPRLGHPRARRPRPGRLRVVRRPGQLPHRPRLRVRRRHRLPNVVAGERRAGPCDRQRHRALPRRVLDRLPALRRPSPAHADPRARLPDRRRSRRSPSRAPAPPTRPRSSPTTARTRCAGGCCAPRHRPRPRTSPSNGSSRPTTRTWPTRSATSRHAR